MLVELLLLAIALAFALAARPWRMMPNGERLSPLLAVLAILPWVWVLPVPEPLTDQLRWSGACFVVLMLGWPIAVPALLAVALLAWWVSPAVDAARAVDMAFWLGILPATLSLGLGWLLRRLLGDHVFIYLLGRAFLGTAACVFLAGLINALVNPAAEGAVTDLSLVARWLMAWSDGVLTGALVTAFVAWGPHCLATWSDRRYLRSR